MDDAVIECCGYEVPWVFRADKQNMSKVDWLLIRMGGGARPYVKFIKDVEIKKRRAEAGKATEVTA